jgi:hypothetical protein
MEAAEATERRARRAAALLDGAAMLHVVLNDMFQHPHLREEVKQTLSQRFQTGWEYANVTAGTVEVSLDRKSDGGDRPTGIVKKITLAVDRSRHPIEFPLTAELAKTIDLAGFSLNVSSTLEIDLSQDDVRGTLRTSQQAVYQMKSFFRTVNGRTASLVVALPAPGGAGEGSTTLHQVYWRSVEIVLENQKGVMPSPALWTSLLDRFFAQIPSETAISDTHDDTFVKVLLPSGKSLDSSMGVLREFQKKADREKIFDQSDEKFDAFMNREGGSWTIDTGFEAYGFGGTLGGGRASSKEDGGSKGTANRLRKGDARSLAQFVAGELPTVVPLSMKQVQALETLAATEINFKGRNFWSGSAIVPTRYSLEGLSHATAISIRIQRDTLEQEIRDEKAKLTATLASDMKAHQLKLNGLVAGMLTAATNWRQADVMTTLLNSFGAILQHLEAIGWFKTGDGWKKETERHLDGRSGPDPKSPTLREVLVTVEKTASESEVAVNITPAR